MYVNTNAIPLFIRCSAYYLYNTQYYIKYHGNLIRFSNSFSHTYRSNQMVEGHI